MAQRQGLGCALAQVRGTSGIPFPRGPPRHWCEPGGITRVSTVLTPLQPMGGTPHVSLFPSNSRGRDGASLGRFRGVGVAQSAQ